MTEALQLLQKYWKHNSFREPQEQIINSVLSGNDALALLPTGGGKSVCYQLPGLKMQGITLVISPLIALIKDQVESLQKKDIKTIALLGGLSQNEVSNLFDNCLYGNYKFLYLSPERLNQDWILERLKQLPINLVAIDEAHCVSQWGQDFRPAYLKIKNLKEYFPKTPFLALTASANSLVQHDIISLLNLDNPKVYKKSFYRENIGYHVIETEDKLSKVKNILIKNPQSSIIYVRNRKATIEVCKQIQALGFTASYYHGGLSFKEKEDSRLQWMNNTTQVMVATNAFGMGIDKPDVKTVIHYQLPENLENYYQEVGRAGRNGNAAFGILLTNKFEINFAETQFKNNMLDAKFLKEVYKNCNTFFQIPYGEGFNQEFSFNLNTFCLRYNLPVYKTFNALQFLDRQSVITLSNENGEKIKLQFIISSKEVIRYKSLHRHQETVIETILRTYTGIFDNEVSVNPILIAKKANTTQEAVLQAIHQFHKDDVISLQIHTTDSKITFNEVREDDLTINKVIKYLETQNKVKADKFNRLLQFIKDETTCKSNLLLHYFDEEKTTKCGICSYCKNQNQINHQNNVLTVLNILKGKSLTLKEIEPKINLSSKELIATIRLLLDNDAISLNENQQYYLKNE
ncbi:ATP-dependent DNA helicase RecQ [Flavobacterium sp.]|uniref:RecQ family ATP-dependent DNA helicase n=1 Tax=Flavobacterium sp. TaxID=239 RepID=UPI003528342D